MFFKNNTKKIIKACSFLWSEIPNEVWINILSFLDVVHYVSIQLVDKHFSKLSDNDSLWQRAYIHHFKKKMSANVIHKIMSSRTFYREVELKEKIPSFPSNKGQQETFNGQLFKSPQVTSIKGNYFKMFFNASKSQRKALIERFNATVVNTSNKLNKKEQEWLLEFKENASIFIKPPTFKLLFQQYASTYNLHMIASMCPLSQKPSTTVSFKMKDGVVFGFEINSKDNNERIICRKHDWEHEKTSYHLNKLREIANQRAEKFFEYCNVTMNLASIYFEPFDLVMEPLSSQEWNDTTFNCTLNVQYPCNGNIVSGYGKKGTLMLVDLWFLCPDQFWYQLSYENYQSVVFLHRNRTLIPNLQWIESLAGVDLYCCYCDDKYSSMKGIYNRHL